jgi:CheY-like chemotaxis protein
MLVREHHLFLHGLNKFIQMKNKSILLIEDDELDVISVQRSMKKIGGEHRLFTAYNGIEALSILKGEGEMNENELPDIILLDINMPKMNGIEFLQELRKNKKFDNIKIFVMTTSNEENDRTATENLGISGYYIKPLNFNDNNKSYSSMDSFMQFYISQIIEKDSN